LKGFDARDGTIIKFGNGIPRAKYEQARQAQDVDAIPTLAWSARPDGSAEFLNRRWLDYTGLSTEEASDWGWTAALHPEDRDRLMDFWRHCWILAKPVRLKHACAGTMATLGGSCSV